jgi:hypothetical protein
MAAMPEMQEHFPARQGSLHAANAGAFFCAPRIAARCKAGAFVGYR